ncbi:hypothetical protein AB205_0198340 [Aquarana catesbeiana]|uniref:Uncharacterized protein n=1 Tax=Aquarana catesbeiana TaxID=8400 RepID=A0A2G9S023_AQUCT|nr:hypothetical protein AB205_0198340 [Aquarana catesbeiana]
MQSHLIILVCTPYTANYMKLGNLYGISRLLAQKSTLTLDQLAIAEDLYTTTSWCYQGRPVDCSLTQYSTMNIQEDQKSWISPFVVVNFS